MGRQWLKEVTLNETEIKVVAAALRMSLSEGFYSTPSGVEEDDIYSLLEKLNLPEDLEDIDWSEWDSQEDAFSSGISEMCPTQST